MISVIQQNIKTIPSLIVVDINKQEEALRTVIYYHGFTSAKEHNLPIAYLLAEKGYRVILPDSLYHGEREDGVTELNMQLSFWDIVLKNVEELEDIKQYLDEHELLLDGQIGVAGTSMGGITTSAVLAKYPWVKAAAILMGSPKLISFANELVATFEQTAGVQIEEAEIKPILSELNKLDLSQNIEALNERPLFIWHGENDQVVPHRHAHDFYNEAKEHYKNNNMIQFSSEAERDHKVSRAAILQTVNWFVDHLNA